MDLEDEIRKINQVYFGGRMGVPFADHYCAVSEARGKMPCMEQCKECYDDEHEGEEPMSSPGREPDYRDDGQQQAQLEEERLYKLFCALDEVAHHGSQRLATEISELVGCSTEYRKHWTYGEE